MTEEIKFLNNEELNFLQNLLKNPYKPFVTVDSEVYDKLCNYSNSALNANVLLNKSDEELQKIEDLILSSINENKIIFKHNINIQSQIEKIVLKIFKNYGVLPKKKNFDIKDSFLNTIAVFGGRHINKKNPSIVDCCAYWVENNQYGSQRKTIKCYENGKLNLVKAKQEIKTLKEVETHVLEEKTKNKKIYLEYALKNNLPDYVYENDSVLIKECNDHAQIEQRNKFMNVNLGEEYHIKCCDECSTWIVGDRRCSCGNVRIDLIFSGDLIHGFYHYAERY